MGEKDNSFALLSMVSIVAIVAIVVLIINARTQYTQTQISGYKEVPEAGSAVKTLSSMREVLARSPPLASPWANNLKMKVIAGTVSPSDPEVQQLANVLGITMGERLSIENPQLRARLVALMTEQLGRAPTTKEVNFALAYLKMEYDKMFGYS